MPTEFAARILSAPAGSEAPLRGAEQPWCPCSAKLFQKNKGPLSRAFCFSEKVFRGHQIMSTPLSVPMIKTSAPRAANNPTVTTPTI